MQPYDKVQNLYTTNKINTPLNCGDVVGNRIRRFDGYVVGSTDYQKYEWLPALNYSYTDADGMIIPFGPLSGNYFVVTTPDTAPYLLAKSNNSTDSAVNIASYYPRGMLIYADGYVYVTETVCSVYDFRNNSFPYPSLYPWSPIVEAKKGRSYVYNGNIYACEKSCYSKIPYIGSEYYTLIQEAPATRFDAVIPLVFLDDAYGSTAPVGTLIANGNGARSDHFYNHEVSPNNDIAPYILQRSSWSGVSVNLSTDVSHGAAVIELVLHQKGSLNVVSSGAQFFYENNPLQLVPTGMLNGLANYGVHCSMFGEWYSDGNSLIHPTTRGHGVWNPASSKEERLNGRDFPYNYTHLMAQYFYIHDLGKIPLSVFDLVHRNGDMCWCSGSNYPCLSTNTSCVDAPKTCTYYYDPDTNSVRLRSSIFVTGVNTLASNGGVAPDEWLCNRWEANRGFFVGYILPSTSVNIVILCADWFYSHKENKRYWRQKKSDEYVIQSVGGSLLKDLYMFLSKDDCNKYVYHVNVDNSRSQTYIESFLQNPDYCDYCGLVNVCTDTVIAMTHIPGVKYEEGSIIVIDGLPSKVTHTFTASSNKEADKNSSSLSKLYTEDKRGFTILDVDSVDSVSFDVPIDRDKFVPPSGSDVFDGLPSGDRIYNPESPKIEKLFKDDLVELPNKINETDCVWEQGIPNSIGKLNKDITDTSKITSKDFDVVGFYLGNLRVVYKSAFSKISPGMFYADGDMLYMATPIASEPKPIGEKIREVWAIYYDAFNWWSPDKGQYILDKDNGILYKTISDDADIKSADSLLDSKHFAVAGVYVCLPLTCEKDIPCMWAMVNSNYPDCYIEQPKIPVADELTVSSDGHGHTVVKGNLLYCTTPVSGNLIYTGSVYAKKYAKRG